jgi:hypothetical protein
MDIDMDSIAHHGLAGSLQTGIGLLYFLVTLMNVGFALYQYYDRKNQLQAIIWGVVAAVFGVHAVAYLVHHGWAISDPAFSWLQHAIDYAMNPVSYFVLACIGFTVLIYFRKAVTEPIVAWSVLMVTLWFSGLAMTNENFKAIITKPDNVPIVMLIFSVGFFTWLALRKAVINDERLDRGEPPLEKVLEDKVLVWPDLVYTELISMIVCTLILIVWAIVLKAPLEQPASSARIPNPSKAPWYFLGLQEMLVYFDPWMAGVVLPTFIIQGLVALPYIDFNQKGSGYYTFKERKFAITTFLFGFVVLWCVLIVLGTFLRGPNWNFFGPFEPWDPHKNVPLNNVNLSEFFWLHLLGMSADAGWGGWFVRELPGLIFVFVYLVVLPPVLAKTIFRSFYIRMGFVRFFTLITLLQFMAALPIKMVLRWAFNLKYIVFIPEFFFNI